VLSVPLVGGASLGALPSEEEILTENGE